MDTISALNQAMLQINQRPIAVFPAYIKAAGCLEGGVLLSQLCFWSSAMNGKPFYKTDAEIRAECSLTEREFRRAKQALRQLPFITVALKGVPSKTWYEIDLVRLLEYIGYHSEPVQPSLDDAVQTGSYNAVQTTTENTSERKKGKLAPLASPKKPQGIIEVDEPFRERMQQKYGGVLTEVNDRIDEALGHMNAHKYANRQLYVQGWLRRDVERMLSNGIKPAQPEFRDEKYKREFAELERRRAATEQRYLPKVQSDTPWLS